MFLFKNSRNKVTRIGLNLLFYSFVLCMALCLVIPFIKPFPEVLRDFIMVIFGCPIIGVVIFIAGCFLPKKPQESKKSNSAANNPKICGLFNSGVQATQSVLDVWEYWQSELPEAMKKSPVHLSFLDETVDVDQDGYALTMREYYYKDGEFYSYLHHIDAGNMYSDRRYNNTVLTGEQFIEMLEVKKNNILRTLPGKDERAKFEFMFSDITCIFENYIEINQYFTREGITQCSVEVIADIEKVLREIKRLNRFNSNNSPKDYVLYWDEPFPSATIRYAVCYTEDSGWGISSYVYNRKPTTRFTPLPDFNIDNVDEWIVEFVIKCRLQQKEDKYIIYDSFVWRWLLDNQY